MVMAAKGKETTRQRLRLLLTTVAIVIAGAEASGAQTAPADDAPAQEEAALQQGFGDIIITATRREESLQKVPVAVSAFSGETLEIAGINSTRDLEFKTPGLNLARTSNATQFFLRGIGSQILTLGSDNSVATFVDGVYRSRARELGIEFLDISRVEVLKGPQGTLYGRNATGGAINVVSAAPTDRFEGSFEAGYGNYDTVEVKGVLNVPVVSDTFLVRLAGQVLRHEGYTENLANTGDDNDLDDQDAVQMRASFLLRPAEDFTVTIIGDYFSNQQNGTVAKLDERAPATARDVFGGRTSSDPREVYIDYTPELTQESGGVSVKLAWDIAQNLSLTALSAYRQSDVDDASDIDGTDVNYSYIRSNDESVALSQSLLLDGETGRLKWLIGGDYFNEEVIELVNLKPGSPDPTFVFRYGDIDFSNEAFAVFAQGTYAITDKVGLTLGLRYASEEKSFDNAGAAPYIQPFSGSESWSSLVPKVGLEYQVYDRWLLYTAATNGFKSGGFNASDSDQPFDPEEVWSYEAGSKWQSAGGSVRVNASVFYYDYSNLQVEIPSPTAASTLVVENAGGANIIGADLDASWLVLPGLTLDAAVGWLPTAEYENYITRDPLRGNVEVDVSGNRMTRAPVLTLSSGAQYAFSLPGESRLTLRGDWSYRSRAQFSQFGVTGPSGREYTDQESYHLFNASVRWDSAGERFALTAYGRNLSDELYRVGVQLRADDTLIAQYFGAPLTYGVRAAFRF